MARRCLDSRLGLLPGEQWVRRRGLVQVPRVDVWWRMSGSNRRPPACKAGALPAELIPHDVFVWWVWLDSNQRPPPYQDGALTN